MSMSVLFRCCAVVLLTASCGWTGEQREIADAWAESGRALSEGDWEAAWPLLGAGTRLYLDSAAVELDLLGVPGCRTGTDLLELTYDEYFDLSGEPTLILRNGDFARLEIAGPEGTVTRWMVLEDGRWLLDLAEPYRDSITSGFEGAFLDPSPIVPPRGSSRGGK